MSCSYFQTPFAKEFELFQKPKELNKIQIETPMHVHTNANIC